MCPYRHEYGSHKIINCAPNENSAITNNTSEIQSQFSIATDFKGKANFQIGTLVILKMAEENKSEEKSIFIVYFTSDVLYVIAHPLKRFTVKFSSKYTTSLCAKKCQN